MIIYHLKRQLVPGVSGLSTKWSNLTSSWPTSPFPVSMVFKHRMIKPSKCFNFNCRLFLSASWQNIVFLRQDPQGLKSSTYKFKLGFLNF
jgi:hypothetical protein